MAVARIVGTAEGVIGRPHQIVRSLGGHATGVGFVGCSSTVLMPAKGSAVRCSGPGRGAVTDIAERHRRPLERGFHDRGTRSAAR